MPARDVPADPSADLYRLGVVPVLTLEDPGGAADLGAALLEGGLPVVEVTFRRPGAERAVAAFAADPRMTVGAGTVLSPEQVDLAADAGATFVVSPGLDEQVVERARERGLFALPGVATPTEIQRALRLGLDVVKLFPAGVVGGLDAVRAFSAPFPGLRFVPTGGITEADLPAYLGHPAVLAVGGSWLVRPDWLADGRWDEVVTAARRAAETVASLRET